MSFFILILCSILGMLEINVANSIDWQCMQAHVVVNATITSCEKTKALAGEKIQFKVHEVLKGANSPGSGEFYFHAATAGRTYKKYEGKNCLLFLSVEKKNDGSLRMTPDEINPENSMICFDDKGKGFATDFTVLTSKKKILEYCKKVIEKQNALTPRQAEKKIEKRYLKVPADTEAWKELYNGSSCYLLVPDVLFPQASPSFP